MSKTINLNEMREEKNKNEKKAQKKKRSNFFSVSNHHELYRIGKSYLEDYKNGRKHFAITSTGYMESQQKTILGLTSYLGQNEDTNILIVSRNLSYGMFKDLLIVSDEHEVDFGNHKISYSSFYDTFNFLDTESLYLLKDEMDLDFEAELDNVFSQFDIVFWDVPPIQVIQSESYFYFPLMMKFESLAIIISKSNSTMGDIEQTKGFFENYGISLKGFLFQTMHEEKKKRRSKWSPISYIRRRLGLN